MIQRMPQFDLQAERGLLGSVFLLPSILLEVMLIVAAEMFYDEAHQVLFRNFQQLHAEGKPLDPTLLANRLQARGELEQVGGLAYLSKITTAVPNAAHATYYAEIVRECFDKRSLLTGFTELLSSAYDPQTKAADLLAAGEAFLSNLAGKTCDKLKPVHIGQSAKEVIAALERPNEFPVHRAMIGPPALDERLGSINSGEMCMIAARPSTGKTAKGQGALQQAASRGRPALMISLEMTDAEIAGREFARETDVDSRVLRSGSVNDSELKELRECQRYLEGLPLYTWSPARATMAEICTVVKNAVKKLGITVVCVDYIGLIAEPDKFKGTRREHLADCSRTLKRLAKECKIPILVLCQLNREAANTVPTMAHLRECGAFEEDADGILLLHREDDKPNERLIIVEKFRNGSTGEIRVAWDGPRMEFRDLPPTEWQG